jgi:2-methylcitrate dehydratase PrpD
MTAEVTRAIAAFVAETPGDAIPAGARQQAARTVVDSYATAVAGSGQSVTEVVWESLRDWTGPGRCHVVRDPGASADPPTAALVNGVAAHCLDFDTISFAVSGFIGSALTAALTALADDSGDGYASSDVLTAYCLGWEGAAAVARGVNPLHYAKGWHPTATMSGLASALACSRLLGLDAERTAMALGVAVSEASGVKTMIGNMTNAFHVGKAARNGVVAARLAGGGFVSHPAALEATQGFLNLFNGEDGHDRDVIVDSLGSCWDLTDPGPVFKIYPCCGLIHTGIEAVADLRTQHALDVRDVRAVRVLVHAYVPDVMHVDVPMDGYGGKFSIPYCIAGALRDGGVTLSTFAGVDPELVAIGGRVQVSVHPDLTDGDTFFGEEFTEVHIETAADTLVLRRQRLANTGTGGISDDVLAAKVNDCFAYSGGHAGPRDTAGLLADLDTATRWSLW